MSGKVLAIESSCDECSAAVVESVDSGSPWVRVLSNVVFTQIDLHKRFGGVVPEVASRNHLDMLAPVVDEALEKAGITVKDLAAVAVTQRPGLIGALLVGVASAKAIAYATGIPLITVDHLEGHLHSLFLQKDGANTALKPEHLPMVICLASGGHTNLYLLRKLPPAKLELELLGSSRDDAAGEAFDKCGKLLGLPYPAGREIDAHAKKGNPKAIRFPRPMPGDHLEFSFSGLKTALATELRARAGKPLNETELNDLCASVQEAIVDSLFKKTRLAVEKTGARSVAVVGGVSANSRLRERLQKDLGVPFFSVPLEFCTDNAAMIGSVAVHKLTRGETLTGKDLLQTTAYSSS